LFDGICLKIYQFAVLYFQGYLNGITTHFAILDVFLIGNRGIQKHGNFLKAMRASEEVLDHVRRTIMG
jgi:hypothetical protein